MKGDGFTMRDQGHSGTIHTVYWDDESSTVSHPAICLLDQSQLPHDVVYVRLSHEQQVAEAIASLKVRGAPAIGVTAALGIALAVARLLQECQEHGITLSSKEVQAHLDTTVLLLGRTRPTAVNLFWALQRMQQRAATILAAPAAFSLADLARALYEEAQAIAAEETAASQLMGQYGAELIADGDTVLTHCNAGALATVGVGTALAPIYIAHRDGKRIHVFVDETRPVLQGARLTAWELQQAGVPLTLITDNMAGHFMRQGIIRSVFVGADRIAANGDVANKIGTYSVAVLAHAHQIPFYVVAPCSSIDLVLVSGEQIPIEQRPFEEVTTVRGVPIAPAGVSVANPAFDVTPHQYVSAIITERGIARPPYDAMLRQMCSAAL